VTRTSLGIAVVGFVLGASLTACADSGSSNVSEVSPGIPTANVIANQLNNSGLSCEGPVETTDTISTQALDCGGGLKIETFPSIVDRDKAYAAATGSGVAVFVGSTLVQAPNAATAKEAAAITGGILPPPKPTPTPSATPKVTPSAKVTKKPARPAVKVAPKVSPSVKGSKVAPLHVPTVPAAKKTTKPAVTKSPVVAKTTK
jgi:hypothetical protein